MYKHHAILYQRFENIDVEIMIVINISYFAYWVFLCQNVT